MGWSSAEGMAAWVDASAVGEGLEAWKEVAVTAAVVWVGAAVDRAGGGVVGLVPVPEQAVRVIRRSMRVSRERRFLAIIASFNPSKLFGQLVEKRKSVLGMSGMVMGAEYR